ncbi:MAG: Fic family protein [Anaerolineae bacterium]
MWSFRNNRLLEPIDVTVANLMAALGRYQGRQELYQHQAPQVLETLRQIAIVESTEASNRIEGIIVPPDRLKALMAQAVPQTRSESEIAGYRDVLARIHTGQVSLPLTPDAIRALHADLYAYLPGEGGMWKQRDNVIRQVLPNGREVVRFVPLSANETPAAMEEVCHHLAMVWENQQVDRLLVINAFILDFLCIHPFSDGNGRLARLLMLLLLYAAGYEVGRYISLERIIEQTKETYYEALRQSGERWDVGQHDLTPWHQYSLSVLIYAYREFEERVGELVAAPGAKSKAVQLAIEAFRPGQIFAIADLERACPTTSRATIRRVLGELREQGQVECLGTGRSAQWRRL